MTPLEWQIGNDGTCRAKLGNLHYVVERHFSGRWISMGREGNGIIFSYPTATLAKGQQYALWQHALRCHSMPLPPTVRAWMANPLPLP